MDNLNLNITNVGEGACGKRQSQLQSILDIRDLDIKDFRL